MLRRICLRLDSQMVQRKVGPWNLPSSCGTCSPHKRQQGFSLDNAMASGRPRPCFAHTRSVDSDQKKAAEKKFQLAWFLYEKTKKQPYVRGQPWFTYFHTARTTADNPNARATIFFTPQTSADNIRYVPTHQMHTPRTSADMRKFLPKTPRTSADIRGQSADICHCSVFTHHGPCTTLKRVSSNNSAALRNQPRSRRSSVSDSKRPAKARMSVTCSVQVSKVRFPFRRLCWNQSSGQSVRRQRINRWSAQDPGLVSTNFSHPWIDKCTQALTSFFARSKTCSSVRWRWKLDLPSLAGSPCISTATQLSYHFHCKKWTPSVSGRPSSRMDS